MSEFLYFMVIFHASHLDQYIKTTGAVVILSDPEYFGSKSLFLFVFVMFTDIMFSLVCGHLAFIRV